MVFRIKPFDEPEVISRRLMHIRYALYGVAETDRPRLGDGTGSRVIAMDTAFSGMPDAVWLQRLLPNATVAHRSNNREVQARLCANGAGLAVRHARSATRSPISSRWSLTSRRRGETLSSVITAI